MWKLTKKPIFYINITFSYLLITKFIFPVILEFMDKGESFFSGYFMLGFVYFMFIWIPIGYGVTSVFTFILGNVFYAFRGKYQFLKTFLFMNILLFLVLFVLNDYTKPEELHRYILANTISIPIFTLFVMNAYENNRLLTSII